MRLISYDSLSTQVLLDLRYTGLKYATSEDFFYVGTPLYVVADLDSQRFHPLVHGLDIGLVELFNEAALSCPRAIPRDLICRAMFVLALEYEGQRLSLVRSAQEVSEAYMLQQFGQGLGYVSGDEFFQTAPYTGLDDPFYGKKYVRETLKEVGELPKEYTRLLKPPLIANSDTIDSVRLWLYAYDCGEVAEWIVTFDKSGQLLSLEYARPRELTVSGALARRSPYDRIERSR